MSATLVPLTEPSSRPPHESAVMARASGENFPVASRLLGRATRSHLLAIYGFARLTDEIGDTFSGDRLTALDWLEQELGRAYQGRATNPLLVRLEATLGELDLPREPFTRLIQANRQDQHTARYETWEQLLGYCHLSADPVGELVLAVFGALAPERLKLSNYICTALQLTEHWQDVAQDMRSGRIYIPAEDLERFGCSERDLKRESANAKTRELLAFQVARTRSLFDSGAPLLGTLKGRPKLAVAAFLGGGRAALEAIERSDFDVLCRAPVSGRARALRQTLRALLGRAS